MIWRDAILALLAPAVPHGTFAQKPGKAWCIGLLVPATAESKARELRPCSAAFATELGAAGHLPKASRAAIPARSKEGNDTSIGQPTRSRPTNKRDTAAAPKLGIPQELLLGAGEVIG